MAPRGCQGTDESKGKEASIGVVISRREAKAITGAWKGRNLAAAVLYEEKEDSGQRRGCK